MICTTHSGERVIKRLVEDELINEDILVDHTGFYSAGFVCLWKLSLEYGRPFYKYEGD